jgi:alpha-L-fucosidase 2
MQKSTLSISFQVPLKIILAMINRIRRKNLHRRKELMKEMWKTLTIKIARVTAVLAFVVFETTALFAGGGAAPGVAPAFTGQLAGEAPPPAEPLALWYRQPASVWTSALPVGNGRQGAMMFGGIDSEVLCLNEDTLWAGGPYSPENPNALAALPQVRQLLFAGQYSQAEKAAQPMMGRPSTQAAYQPVGDLLLSFPSAATAENYRRELNLRTATAGVQFTSEGVTYTRELFASAPDNVMVLRLAASQPGKINFKLSMRTEENVVDSEGNNDTFILNGTNRNFQNVAAALKFQCRAKILHAGGVLSKVARESAAPPPQPAGGRGGRGGGAAYQSPTEYYLTGADSATILIASATSYKKFDDVTGDPNQIAAAIIDKAAAKGYEALRKDQLADHQKLFDRVSLDLGTTEASKLTTETRIRNFAQGNDPALAVLLFQYGRYLLIGSSRSGGQPANLQGIWNNSMSPSWGSKFTININTEMNYWPVNNTNLGECVEPLMAMVEDLMVTGAKTAKTMYNARGWVAHHNTDLWRATAPIDGPQFGLWPSGGTWLCNTLWDHYEFTQDREFLKRLYPAMKGVAEFFLDTLIEEPTHKWLVTSPSLSPEVPHAPDGASLAPGPTCDMQLLRDLFAHCIEAGETLGVDADLRKQLAETRPRLAPNQIGSAGQLQEWLEDWDLQPRTDQRNRHVSHLYGFYPGEDIPFTDTTMVAAVKNVLQRRGDNATGWGLGWRLNLWARLHDGPHAYVILRNLLSPSSGQRAGVYENLFDAHPPFQIDGNFGGTAGIAEMLVQSLSPRAGKPAQIELLPALPPQWPNGSVKGLKARGNVTVDMTWAEGKLTSVSLTSPAATPASLQYSDRTANITLPAGKKIDLDASLNPKQ